MQSDFNSALETSRERTQTSSVVSISKEWSWMSQSASAAVNSSHRENNHSHRSKSKSWLAFSSPSAPAVADCLACIFQSLGSGDQKICSLVCQRLLTVEGQSRHRLSLNAQADLQPIVSSLFSRFDAVTKLALKCDRRSTSIGDEALTLISLRCLNLTRLKLRVCRKLTNAGMLAFVKNCKGLQKLSCGSCSFGAKGMNAVLDNCASLVKTPDSTNVGLISVSERCKLLRKLHIDGWKSNRVGDEFAVEGQSRHRLSLNAQADLQPIVSSLFSRFDTVTKLALKCDRRSTSIGAMTESPGVAELNSDATSLRWLGSDVGGGWVFPPNFSTGKIQTLEMMVS